MRRKTRPTLPNNVLFIPIKDRKTMILFHSNATCGTKSGCHAKARGGFTDDHPASIQELQAA
ncbi:MAG: hypothetical protein P8N72_12655 [Flavimaricola sp.]|nr:hypothetical protein [Flavimaricola sp.]